MPGLSPCFPGFKRESTGMTEIYVRLVDRMVGATLTLPLEEAAEMAHLASDEVSWALEECGACETERYLIQPCVLEQREQDGKNGTRPPQ